MSIEMKKVWFDGKKMVTQNIPESDIYKRHWDIASCKAYAEQLRDKNRANTAEHAAEAIEYLLTLTQPEQEPVTTMEFERKLPTKLVGPKLVEILNAAGFYRKKEWVGLTDDEIEHLRNDQPWWMVRDIEDKLKDKNT